MNIFELNEKERIKKQVASIESIVEMRKILNDLYDFLNSYSYHHDVSMKTGPPSLYK